MGLFILLALLQRTPIIKYAFQFEKAMAAPVAKLIKATTGGEGVGGGGCGCN